MTNYLAMATMALASLPATAIQEGSEIHDWVKSVVATSLDYHCRAKFGDTEKTITPNPDKLSEKWTRLEEMLRKAEQLRGPQNWIHNKSGKNLNAELVLYFRKLRNWELWLRTSKEDYHRKMDFFLTRIALETVGGDDGKLIYDIMPDDWEEKQDLRGVVSAGLNRELENGRMQLALETQRLELIDSLLDLGDTNATATARELEQLANRVEYESEWLKEYRPTWVVQENIAKRKELFALKESIASRMTPEKLNRIEACPGVLSRQFVADFSLANRYEQQGLPGLALAPANRYRDLLDSAYSEAVEWGARNLEATAPLASQLKELLLATNRVYRPRSSSDGEPFDYVNPIDLRTIQAQSEKVAANGEDYGFLGMIDAPEKIEAIEAIGNELLVVQGKSGLATFDLREGKLQHLMYDLRPDIELGSLAVDRAGKHAYVVTDDPAIVRYDLSSGTRDTAFGPVEVPRKDAKIAVSPDGKTVAMGVFGKVTLYDAKSGEETGRFTSQLNLMIYGIRFSSSGRTLVVHGNGPLNYEYDLKKGTAKHERRLVADKTNAYTYHVRSANGMLAAAGNGAIAAWPEGSDNPQIQAKIEGAKVDVKAQWATVAPDRKHLVCSHGIWDMQSGTKVVRFIPRWNPAAMALTEDGSRLVIGAEKSLFIVPSCLTPKRDTEPEPTLASKDQTEPKEMLADPPEARTWTDSTGRFSVDAVLERVQTDVVVLRKADGSVVEVPIAKLSEEDQKYLQERKR